MREKVEMKKSKIKIRFFAILKEKMEGEEIFFEISPQATCGELLFSLRDQFPCLAPLLSSCLVAVNGSYASPAALLSDGDELALLPPVSGG